MKYLALLLFAMLILSSNKLALADDSSNITPNTAATPVMSDYILYQSALVNMPQYKNTQPLSYDIPNRKCSKGFAACARINPYQYDSLNPGQCYYVQYRSSHVIASNSSINGYTLTLRYTNTTTARPGQTACYDRGGYFTYTIICIPSDNILANSYQTQTADTGLGSNGICAPPT